MNRLPWVIAAAASLSAGCDNTMDTGHYSVELSVIEDDCAELEPYPGSVGGSQQTVWVCPFGSALAAAPEQLDCEPPPESLASVTDMWIGQLDDDTYSITDNATVHLFGYGDADLVEAMGPGPFVPLREGDVESECHVGLWEEDGALGGEWRLDVPTNGMVECAMQFDLYAVPID